MRQKFSFTQHIGHLRLIVLILMITLGVGKIFGQNPVVITSADDITNNTKKLYLIQTNAFQSFYIAPQNDNKITTNNILGDYMLWYFLDAGTESGVQYYYIVNSSGKYICHGGGTNNDNTSRGVTLVEKNESNEERCKFSIELNETNGTTGFYNINAKGKPTYYGLNKKNGSQANTNPIMMTNSPYINDTNSKWKFIPFNGTFTWPTPPFTVSTDDATHYYKIHNLQNAAYYVSTNATPDKVTYSNSESNSMVWYLKEAASDDTWFKYYYLVNKASSDKYMYYSGTATDGKDQKNAVSVETYDSQNEDRYQFIVVQAARGDGNNRVECYAIIPKLLLSDNYWGSNSIGPKDGTMGIINSRSAGNTAQWEFLTSEYPLTCAAPTITYSSETGKITITSTTPENTIHYTTDGETDPSESTGTLYSAAFDVSSSVTIKAIATKDGFNNSGVTTQHFDQVSPPSIQDNGSNAVSITCATPGANIYYTTDGNTPTTSSIVYSDPLAVSGVTIKAIAVKDGMINSALATETVTLQCAKPIFSRSGDYVTISCNFPANVSIYYTKNGDDPNTLYSDPIPVSENDVIKAIAIANDYSNSEVATKTIYNPLSVTDGKYLIESSEDFEAFVDMANTEEYADGHYVLKTNVNASTTTITQPFTGIFEVEAANDGNFFKISGLDHPLFNTIDGGAIVKNVILDGVNITGTGKTGAICNEALGASRIYNCGILSGRVRSTGNATSDDDKDCCGGLVGLLGGSSRVINCYSYATIAGGNWVGGIVGYNSYATKANDIKTMVMNCMFYGDITGGNRVSPVYGGKMIVNTQDGLNNYNYYVYDELKTKKIEQNNYNCALAIEERFIKRFEIYRLLLNSNRKLAAIYATGSADNANQMAKWVLETADRSIDNPKPYPILKAQGTYPSIINYDTRDLSTYNEEERNTGSKLTSMGTNGMLSVTINNVKNGVAPSGAGFKNGVSSTFNLPITDKDFDHYNYNYGKVQLPYYNDYCEGNYTENRVVTGWKITAITSVEDDPYDETYYDYTKTYSANSSYFEYPYYNFADRKSSNKDFYSVSGRVFSQGAYFDVPYGVTSITIEPYWGKAAYIADPNYDVVYKNDFSGKTDVTQTGTQVTVGTTLFDGQRIETSVSNALDFINKSAGQGGLGGLGTTVYDNAVVLVGNLHLDNVPSNGTTPFTMMSVDADHDHEPDYSLIYHHKARLNVSPIRFDFLNVPGTSQAQKPTGSTLACNVSIFKTKGWFEITNTALLYFSQFEYENLGDSDKNNNKDKASAPLILQGGVFDQFVSTQSSNVNGMVTYIHVGGNVWINQFGMGTHSDGNKSTPHVPVSVTGGEYPGFYLTGTYNQDAAVRNDNAECYISGGYFHEVAGASQEQINGSVRWQIYNADIDNFYGGGTNEAKPIKGDVRVDIFNSHVGTYCGGPKFGNMQTDKTVTSNATGCVFGTFYGAGNGGTSFSRKKYYDEEKYNFGSWDDQYINDRGNWFDGKSTDAIKAQYGKKGLGVAADFDYEFFVWSKGNTGGRFFVKFASFSLAQCNNVSSTLNGCTITGNFYGGGNLGKVTGTATSVLDGCTVNGNVFGGGYSATIPTVEVRNAGFTQNPNYNSNSGMFEPAELSGTTTFEWKNVADYNVTLADGQPGSDLTKHYLYTNTDLTTLGQVAHTNLTITGNTKVNGGVFGGGDESKVNGNTQVTISNGVSGVQQKISNVYGGGNKADVGGTVTVDMESGTITNDIYGGGAFAHTNTNNWDATAQNDNNPEGNWTLEYNTNTYHTTVNLTGGKVRNVYGGALGDANHYAQVYGNVLVKLNDGVTDKGCIVNQIFGANNANGTPRGKVEVHVFATQEEGKEVVSSKTSFNNNENYKYDVKAVYGGGNQAAYRPYNSDGYEEVLNTGDNKEQTGITTKVIIEGCGNTSIESVYGGGNAAPVPGTEVTIEGSYKIGYVFGGGNGKDLIELPDGTTAPNPGADVGYYKDLDENDQETDVPYGTGNTRVNLKGGTIEYVFGGSNTLGNIRITSAVATLQKAQTDEICELNVSYIYGAGQEAEQDGGVKLILGCINEIDAIYGGARLANIKGGVDLVITSGKFDKIFGGNDQSGTIQGPITLTIEENGCYPIEIGELYLGGNQAAYSTFGYYVKKDNNGDPDIDETNGKLILLPRESADDNRKPVKKTDGTYFTEYSGEEGDVFVPYRDPVLNIVSCTKIGRIFGGGLGSTAKMYGSPTVNINMIPGEHASAIDDKIGVIGGNYTIGNTQYTGGIYGGGSEANVYGNTTINIGTESTVTMQSKTDANNDPLVQDVQGAHIECNIYGGGLSANVDGNTKVNIGTVNYENKEGVSITGDVFGGGEGQFTRVSGHVEVNIGQKTRGTATGDALITGNVYGGSAMGKVNTTDGNTLNTYSYTYTDDQNEEQTEQRPYTTNVNLYSGTITQNLYGGGLGEIAVTPIEANVYGPVTVNVQGGRVTKVFGANNQAGAPQNSVNVNITDTDSPVSPSEYTITEVYGGGNLAAYNGNGGLYVTVSGGAVNNVFGGGLGVENTNLAQITGDTHVTISDNAHVLENVYGGGNIAPMVGTSSVTVSGGQAGYVFGGGNEATLTGPTTVTVSGGVTDRVFGGGNRANVTGNTHTTISVGQANVVFGGGNVADVIGNSEVNVTGGTINGASFDGGVTAAVFGGGFGNTTKITGNVVVNIGNKDTQTDEISGNATINGDVYGGSALGSVNAYDNSGTLTYSTNATTSVNLFAGSINANLYGGALGRQHKDAVAAQGTEGEEGYVPAQAEVTEVKADVYGPVTVTVDKGGEAINVFGANNLAGEPKGTVNVIIEGTKPATETKTYHIDNVFGGGNKASYSGQPKVTLKGGNVKNLYGGGLEADITGTDINDQTYVKIEGGTVTNNVYGGGQNGNVSGNIKVEMTEPGGHIMNDIYGGGALAHTNTANWDNTGWKEGMNINNKTTYKTELLLKGGIVGNAYGGGHGDNDESNLTPAYVYGDISVVVDGTGFITSGKEKAEYTYIDPQTHEEKVLKDEVLKYGSVYGANNLYGSPMGNITVDIMRTVPVNTDEQDEQSTTYDIYAVYGGGNQAEYYPAGEAIASIGANEAEDWASERNRKRTQVNIHGCDNTLIGYVYGGGNSARVPSTEVTIYADKKIDLVFGGGNGLNMIKKKINGVVSWAPNEGAPVTRYTRVRLIGGEIGMAFGGSNVKGVCGATDIQQVTLPQNDPNNENCSLVITSLFGGGNGAEGSQSDDASVNEINITVGPCVNQSSAQVTLEGGVALNYNIKNIIGGANRANVNGGITLNVVGGVYDNVYGGNYTTGQVNGPITVNIEETDCQPLIIGNLYGAGYGAPYPGNNSTLAQGSRVVQVNIKSCTNIANVYGGGFNAPVDGNTTVNIEMARGRWAGQDYSTQRAINRTIQNVMDVTQEGSSDYTYHIDNAVGTIGNVYGGGYNGNVTGNATVNIGTMRAVEFVSTPVVTGLTQKTANDDDDFSNYDYTVSGNIYTLKTKGVNILGDVFGGGYQSDVQGNTNVTIGNATVELEDGLKIAGNVYGGGYKGSVGSYSYQDNSYNGERPGSYIEAGKPTGILNSNIGKSTVTIGGKAEIGPDNMIMTKDGGPVDKGHVFGASRGEVLDITDPKNHHVLYEAYVYNTEVTIKDNAFIKGSVYGGSENGHVLNDTYVYIKDNCQIGNGYVQMADDGTPLNQPTGVNRPYSDDEWTNGKLIITNDDRQQLQDLVGIGDNASYYTTSLPECASWEYKAPYASHDMYANATGDLTKYPDGTDTKGGRRVATDGHTYYGNVFGGGSGVIPYYTGNATTAGHSEWIRNAGIVEGNTHIIITGGHILTNIYGGCETTNVESTTAGKGNVYVIMTGGTLGVPRTEAQIAAHPVTCYLFGAGKGDQRIIFNTWTNVNNTYIHVSDDARIYGSIFGGGEDGHVIENVELNIGSSTLSTALGNEFQSDPVVSQLTINGTKTVSGIKYPLIGTRGTSYVDGNIFGGGRGFSGEALTAGSIGGNVDLTIDGGTILGSVYGGGRLASVGTYFANTDKPNYGNFSEDRNGLPATYYEEGEILPEGKHIGDIKTAATYTDKYGWVNVTINGGTIGNDVPNARYGGNVFGGSMGRLTLLNGQTNPDWPKQAQVKNTAVNISGTKNNPIIIKRNVFGGSEFGTVRENTSVNIGAYTTIIGSVYGGGYGYGHQIYVKKNVNGIDVISDKNDYTTYINEQSANWKTEYPITVTQLKEEVDAGAVDFDPEDPDNYITIDKNDENAFRFIPMQFAGCVGKRTYVTVDPGAIIYNNVYGGGDLASVGIIDYRLTKAKIHDKHNSGVGVRQQYFDFGLSWPYDFTYTTGYEGTAFVTIKGGRIGIDDGDDDNGEGDVYGGSKGLTGDRYETAFCANVKNTYVNIHYTSTPDASGLFEVFYDSSEDEWQEGLLRNGTVPNSTEFIMGSVYGGSENGHVIGDTHVDMTGGLIGHVLYGGGKGKDKYIVKLIGWKEDDENYNNEYDAKIYGVISGKVFGNTYVKMTDGHVIRNIYGGGNIASVGIGNYSGGADDYSTSGYGELPEDASHNLWTSTSNTDLAYRFLNSGKTKVEVYGGTVGFPGSQKDDLPTGNVYGGCRGKAVPVVPNTLSPRWQYCPEFYAGYVNETEVIIGREAGGPTILGSVYGGGQDGHVRRSTYVTLNKGEIGVAFTNGNGGTIQQLQTLYTNAKSYAKNDVSGVANSLNEDDIDNLADPEHFLWRLRGNVFGAGSGLGMADGKYGTAAGSVTVNTHVTVNSSMNGTAGNAIHRNVYGGGSLATVGPPKITQTDYATKAQTLSTVIINGTVGDATSYAAHYGGYVFAASRGANTEEQSYLISGNQDQYSTVINTKVEVSNAAAHVYGDVYGGGERGNVLKEVEVNVTDGTIDNDIYGGGAYASTNTKCNYSDKDDSETEFASKYNYDTKIILTGGSAKNVFGGGLGSMAFGKHNDNDANDPNIQPVPLVQPTSGDVIIELNDPADGGKDSQGNSIAIAGFATKRIFGGSNLAGTPLGHIHVHVHGTRNSDKDNIAAKYPKLPIYKEKDYENETLPEYLQRLINGLIKTNSPVKYLDKVDEDVLTTAQTRHDTYVSHLEHGTQTQAELDNVSNSIENVRNEYIKLYDVIAVYGGGNMAPYIPTNANVEYTEVLIEGCGQTSIYQVYGGGNAASVPATQLTIDESYDIYEAFGGGNGKDEIEPVINGISYTYPNPGANVGLKQYSYFKTDNNNTVIVLQDDTYSDDPTQRILNREPYSYGEGTAKSIIDGGRIHFTYGGSNTLGNIRIKAESLYRDESIECPVIIEESYAAGKEAEMDGEGSVTYDCVKGIDYIYGGSKNANIYTPVTVNITNGTFKKVFGGNNETGTIQNSITVNIKEEGCQPIHIEELYAGGYKAPYSIYGYKADGTVRNEQEYLDLKNGQATLSAQITDLETQLAGLEQGTEEYDQTNSQLAEKRTQYTDNDNILKLLPYHDPIINVISATEIGTIYGGGYDAPLYGNPRININMEDGRIAAKYADTPENKTNYPTLNQEDGTRTIPLGKIGTIFGGGNLANIYGNTHVNIGTGQWLIEDISDPRLLIAETRSEGVNYTLRDVDGSEVWVRMDANGNVVTDQNGKPVTAEENPLLKSRNKAIITGNVFGGGSHGDVTKNTHIKIANGLIMQNIYGGGEMGSVGTIKGTPTEHRTKNTTSGALTEHAYYDFGLSWPVELKFEDGTGETWIDITGGRIGTSGDDNGDVFGGGKGKIEIKWSDIISSGDWNAAALNGKSNEEKVIYFMNEYRYKDALETNVKETHVNINLPAPDMSKMSIQNVWDSDEEGLKYKYIFDATYTPNASPNKNGTYTVGQESCIAGSVYGGAEDGHVIGNTNVTLTNGLVGHAIYGGGKGKGRYTGVLYDVNETTPLTVKNYETYNQKIAQLNNSKVKPYNKIIEQGVVEVYGEKIYSLTAGKVYGNTNITMYDGVVMRNIYGGGNLGSIGKGNYSGGINDYAKVGYGEMPESDNANLWPTSESDESSLAYQFMHSGKTNIIINKGQLGFIPTDISKPDGMTDSDFANLLKTLTLKDDQPTGNVFGGCRGKASPSGNVSPRYMYIPEFFLGYVNETDVTIGTKEGNANDVIIYGTVYGGGQDGHVRRDTKVTINNAQIGLSYDDYKNLLGEDITSVYWTRRGSVFGAGSGVGTYSAWEKNKATGNIEYVADGINYSSGSVTRSTTVDIKGNSIIFENVYGGGAIASIGPPPLGNGTDGRCDPSLLNKDNYFTKVNISDKAKIGVENSKNYGGNVYGASRGNTALYNAALSEMFATDTYTEVNINGGTVTRNVFGGGMEGIVKYDTYVNIAKVSGASVETATIGQDVFGGGDQADVKGNTNVAIDGGLIMHNVYGGGNMGSVGDITYIDHNLKTPNSDGALFDFGLSWPVEMTFAAGTGTTNVTIKGGRIGTSGDDNGDVFGGGKGKIEIDWKKYFAQWEITWDEDWTNIDETDDAEKVMKAIDDYRFQENHIANVRETNVTIDLGSISYDDINIMNVWDSDDKQPKYKYIYDAKYTANEDPTKNGTYTVGTESCITGSVYGGAENGHVYEDTYVTLESGMIGHSLYGGGKGKGKFEGRLLYEPTPGKLKSYTEDINSLTAGKVYGNTHIIMENGHVMRNIFGGGNLGSVGKGNYSGGQDDYSLVGYGELPEDGNVNLWKYTNENDLAYKFINSGNTYINIQGGNVGYIPTTTPDDENIPDNVIYNLSQKDDLPTGNVFGGCRGKASPNGSISPRYKYIPDFFLGYVNQTEVIIGATNGKEVTIWGSVYGGGQDGHVRRGTKVTIGDAEIGIPYEREDPDYRVLFGTDEKTNLQWKGRGNVFGAGSGIGQYKIKNADGDDTGNKDYNYSSGSVTTTTTVTINPGAEIHNNVFGGGSLASVGPPNTGKNNYQGFAELNTTDDYPIVEGNGRTGVQLKHASTSQNNVIINGGTVGDNNSYNAGYGGNVFGAGRGNFDGTLELGEKASWYANSIWTNVEARNGVIYGNVYGGGLSGPVTKDTRVVIGGAVPVVNNAPRRAAPAVQPNAADVQPNAAAPAINSNSSNTSTPANVATEAPVNRTITTRQAQ